MDRVTVKDLVDLMDYDRTGETIIRIDEGEGRGSYLKTSSLLVEMIADFTVASVRSERDYITIKLIDEEFDRFLERRAQE